MTGATHAGVMPSIAHTFLVEQPPTTFEERRDFAMIRSKELLLTWQRERLPVTEPLVFLVFNAGEVKVPRGLVSVEDQAIAHAKDSGRIAVTVALTDRGEEVRDLAVLDVRVDPSGRADTFE